MSSTKFWILVYFLAMVVFPRGTSVSQITCTAGRFELGQTASVTCFFHKDVRASRTAFDMTARYFDASNYVFNIVNCNWFPNGTLNCVTQDGFVMQNQTEASNSLTVDIPTFTENHTGIYKCHVFDDVATTEACYLLSKIVYKCPQPDDVTYIILWAFLAVMGVLIVFQCVLIIGQRKGLIWRRERAPTDTRNYFPTESRSPLEPQKDMTKEHADNHVNVHDFERSLQKYKGRANAPIYSDDITRQYRHGFEIVSGRSPYFNAHGITKKPFSGLPLKRT